MIQAKKSDAKGRIALGSKHACQTFLIEENATGDLVLKKVVNREAILIVKQPHKQELSTFKIVTRDIGLQKMRGFLKGIDTRPRNKDWI